MGILNWLKNVQPEGTLTERIRMYGLDRISGLTLVMQEQIANTIGRFEKGRLPWLRGASSEEKRCVSSWSDRIRRDFEAVITESTEFYSLDQLPCPKAGVELALMTCILFNALEGNQKGEAAAQINYYFLASFFDVATDIHKRLVVAAGAEGKGTGPSVQGVAEGCREIRQREHARLASKFQDFMASS